MSLVEVFDRPVSLRRRAAGWATLSLMVIFIFPLISLPGPSFTSGPPWKVELLSGLFVASLAIAAYFSRNRNSIRIFDLTGNELRLIIIILSGFTVWSGASALWAASGISASHHTLVWAIYLIVFLTFVNRIQIEKSIALVYLPIILTTAVVSAVCIIDFVLLTDFASTEGMLRIRYGKYAELLITIVPVLWALTLYARPFRRKATILICGMAGWLTVMLSLSKGAFLAGIAGFVVLFLGAGLCSGRSSRLRVIKLAALWVAFTVATQIFFSYASAVPSTANYISGDADPTRTTSSMRVFTWNVATKMAADNILLGVGADNFGLNFNRARAAYALGKPDDATLPTAEDYVVERAHNEYLQILDELGIVGFAMFAGAGVYFMWWLVRASFHRRFRLSPMLWASVAGMTAFFVSSAFSSFSFRAMQNGIAFFIVLAVAANELRKITAKHNIADPQRSSSTRTARMIGLAAAAVAVLMILSSSLRSVSSIYAYRGERSATLEERRENFETAFLYYPENAAAYFSYGMRLAGAGEPGLGAFYVQKAIDLGLGTSVTYSLLAMLQEEGRDFAGAEATMAEAVAVYPRSVFVRVRYSLLLAANGKANEAGRQKDLAAAIDPKSAAGWYSLINEGSTVSELRAISEGDITRPSDLSPQSAVIYFSDEFRRTRYRPEKIALDHRRRQ